MKFWPSPENVFLITPGKKTLLPPGKNPPDANCSENVLSQPCLWSQSLATWPSNDKTVANTLFQLVSDCVVAEDKTYHRHSCSEDLSCVQISMSLIRLLCKSTLGNYLWGKPIQINGTATVRVNEQNHVFFCSGFENEWSSF